MSRQITLTVTSRADADRARRESRALALDCGFSRADAERVALAASELATNLVRYAPSGTIRLTVADGPRGRGLRIESTDDGPGIANLDRALEDGFSTGGGLGSGLPATRRLMDEFEIATGSGGTRIVASKWPSRR
jgi:serine/threonine-protein kinase RsbT